MYAELFFRTISLSIISSSPTGPPPVKPLAPALDEVVRPRIAKSTGTRLALSLIPENGDKNQEIV